MKVRPILAPGSDKGAFADHDLPSFDMAYRLKAAIWVYDIDHSRILHANDAACHLWKSATEADLMSRDLAADMTPSVSKRLRQYQSDFEHEDVTFTELWTLYPNDQPKSVMVVYRGYRLADGRMAMLCEVVGEIEDEPQNLRSAEALLHTDVMIMLFDRTGPALYLNPAAVNAFGGSGTQIGHLFVRESDLNGVLAGVAEKGELRQLTRLASSDGDRWFDLTVKRCSDSATGRPAVLMTAIDVTELKEARDTARHLADRDQLTNLHNRSYLQDHFETIEKVGTALGAAVIAFDVDRFKQINDRFGHEAGDTVLRQIGIRTRAVLEPEDLVARLGGDEFIVVLDGEKDEAQLDDVIAQIRRAIARPILHGEIHLDVAVSVGVSRVTETSPSFSMAMREADIALYMSKAQGRDRVTVFDDDLGRAVAKRERLEIALKLAVARNEFVLHFQPRLDLQTGQIVAAEGLIRWHRPGFGLVAPDEFISVCEETGLIGELGRMVLREGCKQAIAWHKMGLSLSLSLNVSPRQFSDENFLDCLSDLSAQDGFPAGQIELEITENALIGDPLFIAEKLRAITGMGYKIAIDDFGTGYSNLSYISEFPLSCLKIDRSFVNQLPGSGPIVQLILTLAQEIGATVVSEGVETREQLQWLRDRNCTQAQGYFVTRALPASDFEAFVDAFSMEGLLAGPKD